MSVYELYALRCVGEGVPEVIKPEHRDLLIRMGLVRINGTGILEITQDGKRRLVRAQASDRIN
jgi:hypothetical protein